MKVLKDNREEAQFKFPMKITCLSCKSVLEANKLDVKHMPGDSIREPGDSGYYYVECPLCRFKNAIRQNGAFGSLQPTEA